jgi:hypothetical protein
MTTIALWLQTGLNGVPVQSPVVVATERRPENVWK